MQSYSLGGLYCSFLDGIRSGWLRHHTRKEENLSQPVEASDKDPEVKALVHICLLVLKKKKKGEKCWVSEIERVLRGRYAQGRD